MYLATLALFALAGSGVQGVADGLGTLARLSRPRGVVVGGGGARRLVRMVGEARAMEMLLCARTLDAETALSWGLVTKVVPAAELEGEVARLARSLTARSDLVLYAAKAGVRQATDAPEDAGAWTDTLFNVLARRPPDARS